MRAVLFVAMVACGSRGKPAEFRAASDCKVPKSGGTLHVALSTKVISLDPLIGSNDEQTANVTHPLFDTLVDFAPDSLALQPRLASSWEVSPDGLVYTFHLRSGVTYEDGRPIVAGDFKYALERTLQTTDAAGRGDLVDVKGVAAVTKTAPDCAGITAPDDRTLVIKLAKRNAAFIYVMTMSFTSPERRDYVASAGDKIRQQPLATGPYRLESWDEGQRIILARNPHYYDPSRGRIERIEILENMARDTQYLMFKRGELDAVEHLTPHDLREVESEPQWTPYIHRVALMNAYGSRMNTRVKPFDDVRVRQAFNYALDKSRVITLLAGTGVPSHGILPPGMPGRDDRLKPYDHDPVKARALLAEAGYPDGLDVDYVVVTEEDARHLAEALQQDFAEVGIRVHVSAVGVNQWEAEVGQPDGPPFSYDGWVADYPDPINFLDSQFNSSNISKTDSLNNTFYSNPKLDKLLDQARSELEPSARDALYMQAEKIVFDDAPWVWGYHQQMVEVTQPYLCAYKPHPAWERDYTHAWLDLDADGKRATR